jgi:hypothetical protein
MRGDIGKLEKLRKWRVPNGFDEEKDLDGPLGGSCERAAEVRKFGALRRYTPTTQHCGQP